VLVLTLFVVIEAVAPAVWLLMPVSGIVVDARTGTPIEDADAAVAWGAEWMADVGQLDVAEATTNSSGRFTAGNWSLRWWLSHGGYLPAHLHNECCAAWPSFFFVPRPDRARVRKARRLSR
jgi:hypothetical protein